MAIGAVNSTVALPPQPETQAASTNAATGGAGAGAGDLQAIFDQAAAAREEFTRIAVEGNTKIAKFNEKPKI